MFEESTRKPIPMKVKRQVYKRAKGKSEQCGKVASARATRRIPISKDITRK